jgi:hypothetical protein
VHGGYSRIMPAVEIGLLFGRATLGDRPFTEPRSAFARHSRSFEVRKEIVGRS